MMELQPRKFANSPARRDSGLAASALRRWIKIMAVGVFVATGVASIQDVGAQSKPKKKKEEVKNVKSYDFSGDDIDGDLVSPDTNFVDPRKFADHSSLIRLRTDFIREILKSAEDL